MSAYPSLPLFTDAFIADTGHLSAQETGAYLMLIMVAWRSPECRLPDDDDRLARSARVDRRTWLRIKPTVMEFWTLADGFWTQKRLSKERDIVSKRADAARENGRHGGRPKALKDNDRGNPPGSSGVSGSKAPNPNPNPTEQTEDEPLSDAGTKARPRSDFPPKSFERWYEHWPNKVGRDAAERKFDQVRRSGRVTFAELMVGIDRYVASKPPDRDWCHPATWLNQGRWADAPGAQPIRAGPRGQPVSAQQRSLDRARQAHLELMGDPDDPGPFGDDAAARLADGGCANGHHGASVHEPPGGRPGLAPPRPAGPPRPH